MQYTIRGLKLLFSLLVQPGKPKKVIHSVMTLTRTVRIAERYKDKIWAFAYNPTHMAGLQVFFQALSNCNTLINVFNASRTDIYNAIKRMAYNSYIGNTYIL